MSTDNQQKIKELIERKRRSQALELSVCFSLFTAAIVLLVFFGKYLWVFIPLTIAVALLALKISKLFSEKSTSLFNSEIVGVIIKKVVRSRIKDSRKTASYGSATEPAPYQNYAVRIQCGTVFVKTDEGKVVSLGKFDEDIINFLEEGDHVIRFRGSRFPIILNESPSRQKWLCPLCGEVNPDGRDCIKCEFNFNLIEN